MRTAIITGANGNLGKAVVRKFLDQGYRVIGVDGANNHLDFAFENKGFEFQLVNLTSEAETASLIASSIKKYTKLDAAIMLAGGFAMGNMQSTSGGDIQRQFSLNFETAYFVAQPLIAHMQKNGYGRLVFIGARPALVAKDGSQLLAYALTKSLLFKLAEFINAENKSINLVASVVPSTIDTALNRKNMPDADPAHWVKSESLADVLEFICSEKGSPLRETVLKVYNNA